MMETQKENNLPKSDRQSQALKNIETNIQEAIATWKKKLNWSKRRHLSQFPWLFLLGSSEAGKTSLLANSGLSLTSSHSSQIDASKPTRTLQFWSTSSALLVDIPGDWYSAPEGSEDEQRFHHLLTLVNRYHKKQSPAQLLQLIDFKKLATYDKAIQQTTFDCINKQLQFMHDWNPQIEINLIVSKADCIPGFQAFFSHLTQEQKEKPCGLGFIFNDEKPILDALNEQLNAFSDQINSQTIQKLHRERSLKTRDAMKDFPFQIQRLMEMIFNLLENLPITVIRSIKGLYLTSCEQKDPVPNLFYSDDSDSLPIKITTGNKIKNQVFFVQQLFAHLTQTKETVITQKILWRGEYNHLVLALLVLSGITFGLHVGYNNSRQKLSQLNDSLVSQPVQSIEGLPSWFNKLNQLQFILESLNDWPKYNGIWLGLTDVESIQSKARKPYEHILKNDFRAYVFKLMTDRLTQDIENESSSLFYDLATYIRMTQKTLETKRITPWFNQLWTSTYPNDPSTVALMVNSLSQLLDEGPNYTANTHLIDQAQKILEKSPPSQIIFMMLTTQFSQTPEPVDISQPASITKPMLVINPLYKLDRYDDIVNTIIPKLAQELTEENWVLNRPLFKNLSTSRTKELVNSARELYLTAFSQSWRVAFNQLNVGQTTDLNADLELSTYLSSFDSNLWQKLQAVLNFLLSKDELNINEKKYWDDIRENLSEPNNQKLLVAALKENAGYIRKLLYSETPGQSAFEEAKQRMATNPDSNPLRILQTLGKISPEPIKIWLQTLSQQSWQHLLQVTASYINSGWQTTIYADYMKHIQNRFPVFNSSDQDISITDFNAFFGIGGSVQQFYGNYLNGFVNTDESYWTLKELDGLKLPIERSALDAIIRGSLIQKMFYKDNKEHPSVGFTLTPVTLSHGVTQFVLNIGGQMYTVTPESAEPFEGTWPAPDGDFVTLRFLTSTGNKPTVTKTGPWAWLRLLTDEQVKATNDPTQFDIVFDLAGNGGSFRLTANNRINPYLPGLLDEFRLSDNLIASPTSNQNSP